MPRKAATESGEAGEAEKRGATTEPRRSSRIKEQPQPKVPAVKKTKPRAKKADNEADKDGKPKSSRGKKRKAEDEAPNGDGDDAASPTEKKVRFFF